VADADNGRRRGALIIDIVAARAVVVVVRSVICRCGDRRLRPVVVGATVINNCRKQNKCHVNPPPPFRRVHCDIILLRYNIAIFT